eukprot:1930398-Alexandrium_andersonii.AAC.1
MSASLVGSEMCIRDRLHHPQLRRFSGRRAWPVITGGCPAAKLSSPLRLTRVRFVPMRALPGKLGGRGA